MLFRLLVQDILDDFEGAFVSALAEPEEGLLADLRITVIGDKVTQLNNRLFLGQARDGKNSLFFYLNIRIVGHGIL